MITRIFVRIDQRINSTKANGGTMVWPERLGRFLVVQGAICQLPRVAKASRRCLYVRIEPELRRSTLQSMVLEDPLPEGCQLVSLLQPVCFAKGANRHRSR